MPTDAQIAGGHKANINNPNTSEESKQHSRDVSLSTPVRFVQV